MNEQKYQLFRLFFTVSVPIIITATYLLLRKSNNLEPIDKKLIKKKSKIQIIQDTDSSGGMLVDVPIKENPEVWTALGLEQPLVIAMVGLPARGKSYIVKMIIRYLKWTGFECEVFNVGAYRRKIGLAEAKASFFSSTNSDGQKVREEMAIMVQNDMYQWLHEGQGSKRRVAIFDATNTTKERRLGLAHKARKENSFLLFVESICDDQKVLLRNYELKLQNDDYKGMDTKNAMRDFIERVEAYEKVYQTIEDDEDSNQISYIKLINVGQKVITRNCTGYLPSQVAFYLQNVHIQPRKIYLTLNAETLDSIENDNGKCVRQPGTDSCKLTEAGKQYSLDIAKYMQAHRETYNQKELGKEILTLAGTSQVHAETVLHLRMSFSCYNTPLLNELRAGDFHGLTSEEFKKKSPYEYEKRSANKLTYRYPGIGGESYQDVIERIRPIIIELERQRRSCVIVTHLAVARCIYAYFMGVKSEEIPYLPFQRHHVYELTPGSTGCKCREFSPFEELHHI